MADKLPVNTTAGSTAISARTSGFGGGAGNRFVSRRTSRMLFVWVSPSEAKHRPQGHRRCFLDGAPALRTCWLDDMQNTASAGFQPDTNVAKGIVALSRRATRWSCLKRPFPSISLKVHFPLGVQEWSPQPPPSWVTCIPSRRHPHLILLSVWQLGSLAQVTF